jgi:hypothetical protein
MHICNGVKNLSLHLPNRTCAAYLRGSDGSDVKNGEDQKQTISAEPGEKDVNPNQEAAVAEISEARFSAWHFESLWSRFAQLPYLQVVSIIMTLLSESNVSRPETCLSLNNGQDADSLISREGDSTAQIQHVIVLLSGKLGRFVFSGTRNQIDVAARSNRFALLSRDA